MTTTSALAQALGRIPCGLYIVSTEFEGRAIGFLGSFVMQVGFDPPTVCVAVGKGRDHLAGMRASGRFAVSIIDEASKGLMGNFFKQPPAGESAFDGLATKRTSAGGVVLGESLAWLDCALDGVQLTGDHAVVFGKVEEGELLRPGDPKVHLRQNGLAY
jgi:flavin reductase (DIM6/NTAB) family NADH-FMN oxidoreductase RutF